MLIWTWGRWPDVLVDFGRELYVPWQLANGRVLYRDVAYLNGPFSPCFNALLFRLFGAGLRTLVSCNLAWTALLIAMIYRIGRMFGDRFIAAILCITFAAMFGFGQLTGIGNYNFICPYSHEMTHGLCLATAGLLALLVFGRTGRPRALMLAGSCLGLTFLTKPEIFLAALAAFVAGLFVLRPPRPSPNRSDILRRTVLFFACFAAPLLIATAMLSLALPLPDALRGVLGSWPAILSGKVAAMPFYRGVLGTDHPRENLAAMFRFGAGWLAVLFVITAVGWSGRNLHGRFLPPALAFGAATFALAGIGGLIDWEHIGRALPLLSGVVAAVAGVAALRQTDDPHRAAAGGFVAAVFAFVLLGKTFLNARVWHYGFVLAMPAALLTVWLMVYALPAWIGRRGGDDRLARAVALGVWFVTIAAHLSAAAPFLADKNVPVATGADAFRADDRGRHVESTRVEIARRLGPNETLAVFPDGAVLNFLTRRSNPTPYITFMPPELSLFGEDRMLDALRSHPPDYVALVHRDTSEYGFRFFGRDYGLTIADWIHANYRPVWTTGAPPFADKQFGIVLLHRRAADH